jgi:hypothetical protein
VLQWPLQLSNYFFIDLGAQDLAFFESLLRGFDMERGRTPADRGEPMLTWPLGLHARPTVELSCSLCHRSSRPTIAMGHVVGWPSSPWHDPLNVLCPASRPECPAIVVRNAALCAGHACLCLIKVTLPHILYVLSPPLLFFPAISFTLVSLLP